MGIQSELQGSDTAAPQMDGAVNQIDRTTIAGAENYAETGGKDPSSSVKDPSSSAKDSSSSVKDPALSSKGISSPAKEPPTSNEAKFIPQSSSPTTPSWEEVGYGSSTTFSQPFPFGTAEGVPEKQDFHKGADLQELYLDEGDQANDENMEMEDLATDPTRGWAHAEDRYIKLVSSHVRALDALMPSAAN